MHSLNIFLLLTIFLISSAVTWFAGITLAKTTDSLDTRFRIGDALGGLILLGITGSLPEIAIVASAAVHGDVGVIVGNLIGGIAIQTLVLVMFDFATKGKRPLSYLAGSIMLFCEVIFAMVILLFAVLGTKVPASAAILNVSPISILIVFAWVIGLFILDKVRENPKFEASEEDAAPGRKHKERRAVENHPFYAKKSTLHVILIFLGAAAITLVAGVLLEETGTAIATKFGIGTGIFAATVLALVTALPEISTGLESIFIGDNQLAISDILGGNAFMIPVFLMADLIAGKPILSYAGDQGALFGILGIVMMSVYAVTFIIKLKKRHFRLGLDSILEIILYAAGIILLLPFLS